ncbi:MAG: FlgD immunoglobulin-like domain containing protein [Phycisphaeraceae bacterium]
MRGLRVLVVAMIVLAGCTTSALLGQHAEAPSIKVKVPASGRLSLAIYDEGGQVVREILRAEECDAGEYTVPWDGLNSQGEPAPAGQYHWRTLYTPGGLTSEYIMALGSNYPAGDDWRAGAPGSHAAPQCVAIDQTGIYMAARGTENIENYMVKVSLDGKKRLWSAWTPQVWKGAQSMALANGQLYVLSNTGKIWRYDPDTGQTIGEAINATWTGTELKGVMGVMDVWQEPMDMDAGGGFLIVSDYDNDGVRWLDPKTGEVKHKASVVKPIGVTADGNDHALVCAGDKVLRLNRLSGEAVTLIEGLDTPTRLAIDPTDDTLLVSQVGKTHQVVRYHRDGKKITSYGKLGGRTHGLYTSQEQESFLYVTDITSDKQGGFLTCQPREAPRRVSHYNRAGQVTNEWYGGQIWAPWVGAEPGNPRAVWMASGWFDIMRLEVDYAKRTWRVHSTYKFEGMASGMIGKKTHDETWDVREHGGEIYLCATTNMQVLKLDRTNWRLLPVAIERADYIKRGPESVQSWRAEDQSRNRMLLWTDGNGDGQPQKDEARFHNVKGFLSHMAIGPDLSYYAFTMVGGTPQDSDWKLITRTPSEWNSVGAPVYPTPWQDVAVLPNDIRKIEPRWGGTLVIDGERNEYYAGINDQIQVWNTTASSTVVKMNSKGEVVWRVSERGKGRGQVDAFRRGIGFYSNCAMFVNFGREWHDDRITRSYVWDRDGLWVGALMDNPDFSKGRQWDYSLGGEARAISIHPIEGSSDLYLYACWLNDARVYRISGWDNWRRDSGTVAIADARKYEVPAANLLKPLTPPGEPGLVCEFYNTPTPSDEKSAESRVVTKIDLDWRAAAPAVAKSVRWSGLLWPAESGLHYLRMRPGMRVWANGRELTEFENGINLTRGQSVSLRVEFATVWLGDKYPGTLTLRWVKPQIQHGGGEPIPASAFYHRK